ncbi:aldehyde dehydrogenase family protein, partial [Rhizobium ruizarguesonis]
IDGEWRGAAAGRTIEVIDPSTQHVLGTVPDMDGSDTRAAIAAAEKAFVPWRAKTNAERGALLETWHDLILDNIEGAERSGLILAEAAKPSP